MNVININTTKGNRVTVTETELQRAVIAYLREHSPDRVRILAEEVSTSGKVEIIPAAAMFILKNPEDVIHYTEVIPLDKSTEL